MPFSQQVKEIKKGGPFFEFSHVKVDKTPELYKKFGFATEKEMLITAGHVRDILTPYDEIHSNYHGIKIGDLVRAAEEIKKPAAVFASPKNDGSIVVVTSVITYDAEKRKNAPIVAIISPNESGFFNGIEITTNLIRTMYGRSNVGGDILKATVEQRLLYVDKDKSHRIQNIPGVQFPNNIPSNGFGQNIARYIDLVRGKSADELAFEKAQKKKQKLSIAGRHAATANLKSWMRRGIWK